MITAIQLLQEELLKVGVLLLLLADHLTSQLMLFLLLEELNHSHMILPITVTILVSIFFRRITARVELFVDSLNLPLLITSRAI